MTRAACRAWSLAGDGPDQVVRLGRFRRDHPAIDVYAGPGYWQAQIPLPDGELILTRYRLDELLDELDGVTGSLRPGG